MGWIGVDLDGTLAKHGNWCGVDNIGEPIPEMLQRVKSWIVDGKEVRIFTARASMPDQVYFIEKWCLEHIGKKLDVTNEKDFAMIELWDDRCITVEKNTGKILTDLGKNENK